MQGKTGLRVPMLAVAIALLVGPHAQADIATFNAAIQARDFKTAAAEAQTTWPTLDKSRGDLPVIAREFGFAAYRAGEYTAARIFAEAGAASGAALGEAETLRAASDVLRDMSIHKLGPSAATRDQLYRTLEVRARLPGLDVISYTAIDAVTAYDIGRAAWREAEASAALGTRLTSSGGDDYRLHSLHFELSRNVALYMSRRDEKVFAQLQALKDTALAIVNSAANDEDAEPFARLYWEALAWGSAVRTDLVGQGKMEWPTSGIQNSFKEHDRAVRMLGVVPADTPCISTITMRRAPRYPPSARYKGQIGTVILRLDVDAQGAGLNPEILAAVPEQPFGDPVLRSVKEMRFKPGSKWAEGCSLAQIGKVVVFNFAIQ